MKIMYAANEGAGPSYEIETDRQGSYTIRYEGRVVKRVTSVTTYFSRPRWGSRRLELAAIEEAKAAIDAHHAVVRDLHPPRETHQPRNAHQAS